MSRLKEQYQNEIVDAMIKKFGYKNIMEVPKLDKVVINMGVGEAKENAKVLESAVADLEKIAGQKAVLTRAKNSVANFKIREGMPIGCKVTLRGLTGRKIIVDTYGGMARHGGGAFSGKDCTKVDRSAAYAARYAAKNIVAAGLADKCEIQLSYAIGVAQPTSIMVDTFGTGKVSEEKLVEIVRENFDLRPAGIIKMLDLRRPIYKQTSSYGHFGRNDLNLPWEKLDKAEVLKKYL